MPVDEFGRELPPGRGGGGGGGRPASPPPSPHRNYGRSNSGSHYNDEYDAPSDLYQALPTSRGGVHGGGSGRKRRNRPDDSPTRKPSAHTEVHPSKLYIDEPMLCKYLWESEHEKQLEGLPEEDKMAAYDAYRREYCLSYVRNFFNVHLDDAWFRARYSPLGRVRDGKKDEERAVKEAKDIMEEIEASLKSNANSNKDRCYFVVKARLGGGVRQARREDGPTASSSSSLANNRVPTSHVLALSSKVLAVEDVPPHVTDEQPTSALMACCKNLPNVDMSAIKLDSTSSTTTVPSNGSFPSSSRDNSGSSGFLPFRNRAAYLAAPDEVRKEIISQLHNLIRGVSTTITGSGAHVPRKDGTYSMPKNLKWNVATHTGGPRLTLTVGAGR